MTNWEELMILKKALFLLDPEIILGRPLRMLSCLVQKNFPSKETEENIEKYRAAEFISRTIVMS